MNTADVRASFTTRQIISTSKIQPSSRPATAASDPEAKQEPFGPHTKSEQDFHSPV